MKTQRTAAALPPDTAACMGAFDGLHRGHQSLLGRAASRAKHVALVTFDPHPMRVLAPQRAPRLLHTPTLRRRVAAALGIEHLVLLPFDRAMSELGPTQFVRQYLTQGLRPRVMVVGEDFRFGAGRAGDTDALAELLAPAGIEIEVVPPVPNPLAHTADAKLSSSDIRQALDAGRVDEAAALLGRFHSVHGKVIEGAKRGRTIGYPTANVDYAGGYLPPVGVYATFTTVWDAGSPDYGSRWPSVTNVGRNPTFTRGEARINLESHILDQDLGERLYGVDVEVCFVGRIREEKKFDGPAALIEQIESDVQTARNALASADENRVLAPPQPPPAMTPR